MRIGVRLLLSLVVSLLLFPLSRHPTAAQATPVPIACAATPAAATPVATYPLTIEDAAGRQVTIERQPERIISIAPSNTEILYALGIEERVVAVDNYSNFPPEVSAKPDVGDYINPDLESIVAFEPDLILATAAHLATVVPELEELGLTAVVIEPTTLDQVLTSIALVGQLTGENATSQQLVCSLQARVDTVSAAIAGAPRPRVFFELSPDLFTAGAGTFVDDVLTRAGGQNVAADAGEPWPQLSAEALVSADPEVILLADHEAGVTPEVVAARPGWQAVSAVQQGRIVALDADMVARPGPRVVDGLEIIAAALHPDRFPGETP